MCTSMYALAAVPQLQAAIVDSVDNDMQDRAKAYALHCKSS